MDKDELLWMLKENLTVDVRHKAETDYTSGEVRVTILFDGQKICEGSDYVFNS